MKCPDDEILQRFFDGECPHEEAIEVQLHVRTCQHCRHRYEQLQTRVHSINQAFGMLCSDTIDIPPMPLSKPVRRRILLRQKYILPLLAAASILIFFLVFNLQDENNNLSGDQMVQSCFIGELDANKPVDQQELSFTVISPDGQVSEDVVR